jgi:hypothetical protein
MTKRTSQRHLRIKPPLAEGVESQDEDQRDQDEREHNGDAVVHGGAPGSVAHLS